MILYIDISNYVTTRSHTGIQRVVREFLYRLHSNEHTLEYKIIYFDLEAFKFRVISHDEFILFLEDTKTHEFNKDLALVAIDEIRDGDIFFDMDGVWNNSLKRPYLYKQLDSNNAKIFNFIYDLVPVVLPKYSHQNTVRNFMTFLYAVYRYSSVVFFDSRSAEKDFLDIKEQIHNSRNISTRVVKLGSDILQSNTLPINNSYEYLTKTKYILFVGTLEPRKNQTLMLNVFEKLSVEYPELNMVFVGKGGWKNDTLLKRLKHHELLNNSLHWLENIDDSTLVTLYQEAFLCVYISSYEGFGLPVAESLSWGNITITSKNSSMYEVGKNFADYLRYNSFNELYETIDTYLNHSNLYTEKKAYIKENYIPYSWDMTFSSVVDVMENLSKDIAIKTPEKLQFVFISIDSNNMIGTIEAIDKYIDFVASYIIITRADMIEEFEAIVSNNKIEVIDENSILGEYAKDFHKQDHVTKNWLLRTSLVNLEILDNQFVMLDDDNRPLKNIPITHFIEDGKYNAYYFYDLLDWHNKQTDYDVGQSNNRYILDKDGFELLSYSSHKPQIIDKNLFKEVIEYYFEIGLTTPIDEWSIYFNYLISKYPFLFNKKRFDTLNWPGNPSDWNITYMPTSYNFENYYEALYSDGIFRGVDDLSTENKIKVKENQFLPYEHNRQLIESTALYQQKLNLIHGVLPFEHKDGTLFCYGVPYYVEASKGSWFKIQFNYKAIGFKDSKVQLLYWINGDKGAINPIELSGEYTDDIINFAISCTSLAVGTYDLCLDIVVDGKELYGSESPYLVELYIKDESSDDQDS